MIMEDSSHGVPHSRLPISRQWDNKKTAFESFEGNRFNLSSDHKVPDRRGNGKGAR